MNEPARWNGQMPPMRGQQAPPATSNGGANLADILERVLDKGIVIAGDIQINLLDIELLTIKLRLIVASVDRAKEMGIDWWERDPTLSSGHRELEDENRRLRERLDALEGLSTRTDGDGPREIEDAELADDADDAELGDDADDAETDADHDDGEVGDTEAADHGTPEEEPAPVSSSRRRRSASGQRGAPARRRKERS